MRCSRSDGTLMALREASPATMWLAPRLSPSVSIINSPSAVAGGGGHQAHLRIAGRGAVEREPRMGHRMRLDRDHLAAWADVARQRHRVGADIGADIDEHAACRRVRAQEIQLLEIVVGIEQRAALGGAGLMIEAKRTRPDIAHRPDRRAAD